MKRIAEKLMKIQDLFRGVKDDKVKKTCVGVILILLLIPVALVMLKFAMEAMLCLMVHNFGLKFILNLIGSCLLTLALTVMIITILYLNNVVERD